MGGRRRRLVVLFATQKGNAKDIAEYVESLAGEHGWECSVEPVDRVGKGLALERTPLFVIVASTTGEGDVPDHALPFLRHLRALPEGALARSSYAMLALGDTNYNNFCGGGRKIDAELRRAGAHAVLARGEADDASGQSAVIEPWLESLWPALDAWLARPEEPAAAPAPVATTATAIATAVADSGSAGALASVAAAPVPQAAVARSEGEDVLMRADGGVARVRVVRSEPLCTRSDGSRVVRLVLRFDDAARASVRPAIEPGAAVGVLCRNDDALVSRVAARCGLRVDAPLPADGGELSEHGSRLLSACRTWGEFLSYAVDLQATVKPRLLARLAECCGDAGERSDVLSLGGDHGGAAFDERVASVALSLADVLDVWPSCVPSAAILLHHAPRMSARYYSVASARELWPEISIVVAEHVYRVRGGVRRVGVCSRFLLDDCAGSARVFGAVVRAAGDFSLPLASLVAEPAILVATGTGIAPFLALLAERQGALAAQQVGSKASASQWRLYYGVQTLACVLGRDALESAERSGALEGVHVAVSRERQHAAHPHAYVQELLVRDGDALFARLVHNHVTVVCVCGGVATAVARSVEDALLCVLRERAAQLPDGLTPEAAWERVQAERRFRVDVWE